ncbi:hypothetical protein J32TS6_19030 [Virgibacillus pantothenticus]|uniref:hypothetical protein n=1 Tax=Virgibacillus pantothenticus TaxID=1473 RepID=UPI0009558A84|nr:hypothetical protein [Virgibacillus pantothenticus]MED3738083.1 hypothetical protein [Virgibacillus pantothenticus]QTY16932.1 hypothetical protein KBP50_03145 [Virgibacillus pantothenticus]GIP63348.1 hypothetical protein J32TS6_19030 [Virgibacillus pantothenticus]SIT17074.1 hypothetical protein SAMN05421787_12820 [Virgibacillus pantothenticus]
MTFLKIFTSSLIAFIGALYAIELVAQYLPLSASYVGMVTCLVFLVSLYVKEYVEDE